MGREQPTIPGYKIHNRIFSPQDYIAQLTGTRIVWLWHTHCVALAQPGKLQLRGFLPQRLAFAGRGVLLLEHCGEVW